MGNFEQLSKMIRAKPRFTGGRTGPKSFDSEHNFFGCEVGNNRGTCLKNIYEVRCSPVFVANVMSGAHLVLPAREAAHGDR